MRPTSGLTFGGRYQLSSRVAIGGMGEVWQATDLVIGRTVAIKILKDEYLGDPGFLERFRAEARHAALVNHEGIANVFDYGEEDGSAFLVMELVPGEALSTILERERVLSSDRVLDIVAQTANALHAAHSAGLVHRDIKPGNLLITPEGKVKITDFGIARIADQVPLTATGQVMGTVQYLSPEQASGHPASPTTDIYSLGIVAYEALAGRRPFTGESQVAIAMAQINEAPPELPVTIAEPVRNLVYSCIAKNPADRPASSAHLARAAQALRRGDIAGAVASVPAVVGDSSLAALAGPNYGNPTSATRLMTATASLDTTPEVEEKPKRNPWTWPLIGLIVVLLGVLVAVIVALVAEQPTDPEAGTTPSTSASAPAPPSEAPSPSITPSEEPELIQISRNDFVGLTVAQAEQKVTALGLAFRTAANGAVAPTQGDVGMSYDITPTGNLREGDTVEVSFYTEIPTAPAPGTPRVSNPKAATGYLVGEVVTITWDSYNSCPAGYTLNGYNFSVSNATPDTGNPVSSSASSMTARLESPGQTTISYSALCGDLESAASQTTTITVLAAPVPTPTVTSTPDAQ
ncbi:serine/threonine-protein kinase [Glaciihabitans tibetensis]|uniref:non-specific serine/threonine protein kinase n=1 Tax=Glaciihabitans tibetensis TaxID=1266600 RepID=A0A2T0VCP6_9MICO|nr:serine/threonine-protein kinase [Glaciihabitans tibetensis]PRY67950.1 serine/threonine-protein kinase [Glaciihabitans tibetensis]